MLSAMAYLQVRKLGQMGEPEYRVVFYFSLTTNLVAGIGTYCSRTAAAPFHPHTWHGALLLLAIGIPPCSRRWR
jgi:hypothetical protein